MVEGKKVSLSNGYYEFFVFAQQRHPNFILKKMKETEQQLKFTQSTTIAGV